MTSTSSASSPRTLARIEGIEATETWTVLHTRKYNYAWENPLVPASQTSPRCQVIPQRLLDTAANHSRMLSTTCTVARGIPLPVISFQPRGFEMLDAPHGAPAATLLWRGLAKTFPFQLPTRVEFGPARLDGSARRQRGSVAGPCWSRTQAWCRPAWSTRSCRASEIPDSRPSPSRTWKPTRELPRSMPRRPLSRPRRRHGHRGRRGQRPRHGEGRGRRHHPWRRDLRLRGR